MSAKTATTRLAIARLAVGYQQRELAEMARISPARLCEYERGARPPEARRVALAGLLGYKTTDLFPDDMALSDDDVRAWLTSAVPSEKNEELAARPALRNLADPGGRDGSQG